MNLAVKLDPPGADTFTWCLGYNINGKKSFSYVVWYLIVILLGRLLVGEWEVQGKVRFPSLQEVSLFIQDIDPQGRSEFLHSDLKVHWAALQYL